MNTATIFMLYGIPMDATLVTASYRQYFLQGLRHLWLRGLPNAPIYTAGGSTDPSRSEKCEAEVALLGLTELGVDPNTVHAYPDGLDSREALELLVQKIPSKIPHVIIFCAWTHVDVVRVHARQLFGGRAEVIGLVFPRKIGVTRMVTGRTLRLPKAALAAAGWRWERARDFEWRLRLRHMRRHAAFPERLPPRS